MAPALRSEARIQKFGREIAYTRQEIKTLLGLDRNVPEGSVDELMMTIESCNLDPARREIWLTPANRDRTKYRVVTGYMTYVERAHKTNKLNGIEFHIDRFSDGGIDRCSVRIHRKDWDHPLVHSIPFEEYTTGRQMWAPASQGGKPEFMIKKVCLAQGLRWAFGEEEGFGGLPYLMEELGMEPEIPEVNTQVLEGKENTKSEEGDPPMVTVSKSAPKMTKAESEKAAAKAEEKAQERQNATQKASEDGDPTQGKPSEEAAAEDPFGDDSGAPGQDSRSYAEMAEAGDLLVRKPFDEWIQTLDQLGEHWEAIAKGEGEPMQKAKKDRVVTALADVGISLKMAELILDTPPEEWTDHHSKVLGAVYAALSQDKLRITESDKPSDAMAIFVIDK